MDSGDITVIVAIIIATLAIATFFHRSLSGLKRDLQREMDRIWKRIDDLTLAHQTLSDRVSQIIGGAGVVVRGLEVFQEGYKGGENTTPQARLADSGSPVTLTDKGAKLAKKLGAEQLVKKYLDRVRVKLPEDAHKLRIQEVCFNFAFNELLSIVNSEERSQIWDAVYEEGGNSGDVLIIYGILFRDAIFTDKGIAPPVRPAAQKTPDEPRRVS